MCGRLRQMRDSHLIAAFVGLSGLVVGALALGADAVALAASGVLMVFLAGEALWVSRRSE